ncbi:hypothetical protein MJ904_22195 [Massilia sp. MB5]|nr:hypothetical protein [Massilia sp. MB5]UMR29724.1 hypothetical protein MJ904_22195 [Massilia sp. MB5]
MAESTRDMRRSVYERDLQRQFGKMLLHEITHEELRRVFTDLSVLGVNAK